LVEVIADLGPDGYRYGSGCVVAGKTVLTAAHVIVGAVAVTVRDTGKRVHSAEVDAAFVGDSAGLGPGCGPDLALLQVNGLPGDGYPPLCLGRLARESAAPVVLERCHAFGYPGFAESREPGPRRDSVQAVGAIAALSNFTRGLLGMVVSLEPAELDSRRAGPGESPWSGMSGGPVVAEDRLIGVVVAHSLAEGSSSITVLPVTALEANPAHPLWGPGVPDPAAWWRRLAVGGPADLHLLPTPGSDLTVERPSVYLAQVERVAPTELFGRAAELGQLAEFCTAADRGPYLWMRGPAWAGKSALLSWFVLHPPPRVRVLSFFITARLASQDDRVAFADAVLEQALALRGQPIPALLTESTRDAHLLTQLGEAAAVCRARGERLVLVVDGLDEDRGADRHSIAALLPARPVAGLRIVVASRPNPPLPPDVPEGHPLRDPAVEWELAPSPHAALTRASTQAEVKRLLAGHAADRDLLGLIAGAGGGLTARDLAELTGQQAWQVEDRLGVVTGRTFVPRAGSWQDAESYLLGHEELQKEALALLGPAAVAGYRQRVHNWAAEYERRGWSEDTPDYLLLGYFRLTLATGPLALITSLATSPARQARMLARSGADSTAAEELTLAMDALLAEAPPNLTLMVTLAVHRDVLLWRNRNISVELPELWARLGAHDRAAALAGSIADPEKRKAALGRVLATATQASADPRSSDDTGSSDTPLVLDGAESDDRVRQDVAALLAMALTASSADVAVLFHAAEATAVQATDPDLRAELWNDIAADKGSATAVHEAPAEPGTTLVDSYLLSPELTPLIERAAARGDFELAIRLLPVVLRTDPDSKLPATIVDRMVKAGHPERAERTALSFTTKKARESALDRLLELAIKAMETMGVSADVLVCAVRIARALAALGGAPTGVARVAQVAADFGDNELARALLAEALDSLGTPPSLGTHPSDPVFSAEKDALLRVLRVMAGLGDQAEAEAIAIARATGTTQLDALLAVAEVALGRGEQAAARTLAVRVLEAAAATDWGWLTDQRWDEYHWKRRVDAGHSYQVLRGAAILLARLGEVERGSAAASALPEAFRSAMLAGIVEAALDCGQLAQAEALREHITISFHRDRLLPHFIKAYLQGGKHAAALAAAQSAPDADTRGRLITQMIRTAVQPRDGIPYSAVLDAAVALIDEVREHHLQAALRLHVARNATVHADPAQAWELVEAAEAAARSVPDPAPQAEALTAAAWALLPGVDIGRIGMLTVAAEAAARQIPDPTARGAALVEIGAAVAVTGDPDRADHIFESAVQAVEIPSAWADRLAAQAIAAAKRGHPSAAQAQAASIGVLARWIAEPNNRVRAVEAQVTAAIHAGDLCQAERAAQAIEHPDQQALALIDVARARAAAGEAALGITVALTIATEERQADALAEVTRMAAAQGDLDVAEQAADAITARGGRSAALLTVAWAAARNGDLGRAERIVMAMADEGWQHLGRLAIQAQRDALPTKRAAPSNQPSPEPPTPQDLELPLPELLSQADAAPDHPATPRLLAKALRSGPCALVLAPLSRVDPPATRAAADTLLTLLR
jgi:hypothetical protein